ncbi:hypothetical protein DB42_BS00110 [Neochlamydia sp. EPS4]|uniref:hypothetical protein n=1 Tax=Neochlamydia sp. EPS4 TaxID=1478175 RepID=UPI0005831C97|nr:hypothetical protein [Neochlamydia sp. EPS4]KIC73696.1 hypothetical protein DB42_BS00110 [Neochlamydia sp. EPS4]
MKKLNLILTALGVICFTCLSASVFCATPGKKIDDALDKGKVKYKKFKNIVKDKYSDAVEKSKDKLDEAKEKVKDRINSTKKRVRSKTAKTQDNVEKKVKQSKS